MRAPAIIIAGIVGTTAFSIFSYLLSDVNNSDYEEPKLLGELFHRSDLPLDEKQSLFTGWVIHYLIGISFSMAFASLMKKQKIKPTLSHGFIAGTIIAAPAIILWDITLKAHPIAPRSPSLSYYAQLLAGHIIFTTGCILALGVLTKTTGKISAKSDRHI